MTTLIESMTKVKFDTFVVRCWRQEESDKFDHQENYRDIIKVVREYEKNMGADINGRRDLAFKILKEVPRINAVEVLTKRGAGIVLYKDWP